MNPGKSVLLNISAQIVSAGNPARFNTLIPGNEVLSDSILYLLFKTLFI